VAALEAQIVEQEDDRLELSLLEGVNKELEAIENLVAAARARTEATQAYVEFADWSLQQIQGFFETGSAAERELRDARLQEVEANIDHTTAVLLARAISAIQAAAQIAPTMIRQYIDKKDLSKAVLAQQLAEAQADLARLELQQERGVLRSPVDGVVLTRAVVNERVLGAGTLLLEIGRLEGLQVEVDVLTQDAAQIEPGQPADILGAAIGPEPAEGLVRRVHPEGFTKISSLGVEQQRVTVVVDFAPGELSRLAEAGYRLGSAYRVRVRIYTDEQADAVIIPRAALFRSAGGIWQAVTVVDGVADVRNLQIGLMNPEAVAVMAGVEANEQVVLAPDAGLTSGTTLQPVLTNATGK
jgi:HlyD family secretion protein